MHIFFRGSGRLSDIADSFISRKSSNGRMLRSKEWLQQNGRRRRICAGTYDAIILTRAVAYFVVTAVFNTMGVLPFLRLDQIYFDTSLTATLYHSRKALIASDPLPMLADFHLGNPSYHPTPPSPPGRAIP
jgi:hypothetical protein